MQTYYPTNTSWEYKYKQCPEVYAPRNLALFGRFVVITESDPAARVWVHDGIHEYRHWKEDPWTNREIPFKNIRGVTVDDEGRIIVVEGQTNYQVIFRSPRAP